MDIVILDSALKHDITEDRILSCLFNIRGDKLLDDPPPKRLLAGFDNLGNALEIIAVEEEQECLVVIHAMELRKQFYYLLGGN
ncbi:MAG: hypothetical protein LBI14_01595 [Treponema sp.]|jgi:hypothetical protein|nr:hypothetical protein [Treponema sp.]